MCATPVLARDVDDDGGGESEGHIAAKPLSKRQRVEQLLPAGPSTFEVIACGCAPAVVGNWHCKVSVAAGGGGALVL